MAVFRPGSQRTQERENLVIRSVDPFGNVRRPRLVHRALLDLHVRVQVDLRGFRAFMSETEGDHGAADPVAEQFHRGRMPQRVRADPLFVERRACLRGRPGVLAHDALDPVAAEAIPAVALEHRPSRRVRPAFAKPAPQCRDAVAAQRGRAVLAPLAPAPEMRLRFGVERDVTDIEGDQLGDAQAGLQRDEQQGPATAASTAASVPGVRAARQSGRRLNVAWDSGQYQRATRAPAGVLRP